MNTEMHSELVALEDSTLDAVAGGRGRGHVRRFKFQKNEAVVADNEIFANGDVTISITQSND